MKTAHKIELDPTAKQARYFVQACGTDRFTWNWALAEWERQHALQLKPSAMALKKQFNAMKYDQFPWLKEMHRDAHAEPFRNLAKAWTRYFEQIKAGARPAPEDPDERRRLRKAGVKLAYKPRFKRKGKSVDSFYVANDKLNLGERSVRLPLIGKVRLKEMPRYFGTILGATVSREGERWFIAFQMEVEVCMLTPATRRPKIGVDINAGSINLSDGTVLKTPRPLQKAQRRLMLLQRKASRKREFAKVQAGIAPGAAIPKGTILPRSNNLRKVEDRIRKVHSRVRNIRQDFTHKLTTKVCRENQAITIEDLGVKAMTASAKGTKDSPGRNVRQKAGLNRAMLDVAPGEIKRQFIYKAKRFDNDLTLADRFYPSSQLCSTPGCDYRNKALTLRTRKWTCPQCGNHHDRDDNAAANLENYVPGATRETKSVSAKADMQVASKGLQGRN